MMLHLTHQISIPTIRAQLIFLLSFIRFHLVDLLIPSVMDLLQPYQVFITFLINCLSLLMLQIIHHFHLLLGLLRWLQSPRFHLLLRLIPW